MYHDIPIKNQKSNSQNKNFNNVFQNKQMPETLNEPECNISKNKIINEILKDNYNGFLKFLFCEFDF